MLGVLLGKRFRAAHDNNDSGRHDHHGGAHDHDNGASDNRADDHDDTSGDHDHTRATDHDHIASHQHHDDGGHDDLELQDMGVGAPGGRHRPSGPPRRPPDRPYPAAGACGGMGPLGAAHGDRGGAGASNWFCRSRTPTTTNVARRSARRSTKPSPASNAPPTPLRMRHAAALAKRGADSLRGLAFAVEADHLMRSGGATPTGAQLASADSARRSRSAELNAALDDLKVAIAPRSSSAYWVARLWTDVLHSAM